MKIGSLQLENPIILAPMAGISDLPYRLIMKRFGAALVFTEMVSANGLFFNGAATRKLLQSCPEEQPLGVQLFGENPERLAEAVRMIEAQSCLIDLNLGCPVKKVVNSGAGSALLQDPVKIGRILQMMRAATTRPFTVKIRSGWDQASINYREVARIAFNEGVDAITLHPRTRSQGFGGQANWELIRQLCEDLPIPVIGSGDIFSAADAKTVFDQTGCAAVMIGRGGYGSPWLIREILALLADQPAPQVTLAERHQVAVDHLELFLETFGPAKALGHMRKHLCWYVRGIEGAAGFRAQLNQSRSIDAMRELLDRFFLHAGQTVK